MDVREDIRSIALTIRRVSDIASKREGCIRFDIGQPDFDTPKHIKESAAKALSEGKTGYGPIRGVDALRDEIARYESSKYPTPLDEANVMVTCGGMGAIFTTCLGFLRPGDEVILPNPYWAAYSLILKSIGAKPVQCHYVEDSKLILDNLRKSITERTRMIFVNSPSNPTGEVLGEEDLERIASFARENGLVILSDEVYERMLFGAQEFVSIAKFAPDITVRINSFSKTYAMTGWRLGWITAKREWIAELAKCSRATIACPPTFTQYGGIAALSGPQDSVDEMMGEYERRYKVIKGRVERLGWKYLAPRGTFYMFVDTGLESWPFCLKMIEDIAVSPIPGEGFGTFGKTYARFCFGSVGADRINEAFDRIEKWLPTYGK